MKQIFFYLIMILATISCSLKEQGMPEFSETNSADTISVNFKFLHEKINKFDVKSHVDVDEQEISDLNIYIFDQDDKVVSQGYLVGTYTLDDVVSYKGEKYTIYAIANAGRALPFFSLMELYNYRENIDNIEQLTNENGGVLMSGKLDLVSLNEGADIEIMLERCVSKVVVKCDYSGLNPNIDLRLISVELKNAPSGLYLFKDNRAEGGEVINGSKYEGGKLNDIETHGVEFYLYENLQGVVAPSATNSKEMAAQMSEEAKNNSTYIELTYSCYTYGYGGTIVYRYYIGETYKECDIRRNTQYNCNVIFRGDGSINENSWNVDVSDIKTYITGLKILLDDPLVFNSLERSYRFYYEITPDDADNWYDISCHSTDMSVGNVGSNMYLFLYKEGTFDIIATTTSGPRVRDTVRIVVDLP